MPDIQLIFSYIYLHYQKPGRFIRTTNIIIIYNICTCAFRQYLTNITENFSKIGLVRKCSN